MQSSSLSQFITNVTTHIVQPLVALIVAAGVAYFIWGIALFMMNGEKSDERKKGTQAIIWGVVGILIMVAVGTILQIALNTFGIQVQH